LILFPGFFALLIDDVPPPFSPALAFISFTSLILLLLRLFISAGKQISLNPFPASGVSARPFLGGFISRLIR